MSYFGIIFLSIFTYIILGYFFIAIIIVAATL